MRFGRVGRERRDDEGKGIYYGDKFGQTHL